MSRFSPVRARLLASVLLCGACVATAATDAPSAPGWGALTRLRLVDDVTSAVPPQADLPHTQVMVSDPQRVAVAFGRNRTTLPDEAIACGPSPRTNTFSCYSLDNGSWLADIPAPGSLSATPLALGYNAWVMATGKGLMYRSKVSSRRGIPLMGRDGVALWGADSRQVMATLFPKIIYADDAPPAPSETPAAKPTQTPTPAAQRTSPFDWDWHYAGSWEVTGQILNQGNMLYALTTNQFLQAWDATSGKIVWAVRVGTDNSLRLQGAAPLVATDREVLVGTSQGQILAFHPKTGASLWTLNLAQALSIGIKGIWQDRFSAVAAAPLILGRSMVVGNVESAFARISLDTRQVEWALPGGTISTPELNAGVLYVGLVSGEVQAIDSKSGTIKWKSKPFRESEQVLSITRSPRTGSLVAVSRSGGFAVLQETDGRVMDVLPPKGDVVGAFFEGSDPEVKCISTVRNSFRCVRVTFASAFP